MNPTRAKVLREEYGIEAVYVKQRIMDPQTARILLKSGLLVLSFIPATSLAADALLLLLALDEGHTGDAVFLAATFPLRGVRTLAREFRAVGGAAKAVRTIGRASATGGGTIVYYRSIAKKLLAAHPTADIRTLLGRISDVTHPKVLEAVKDGVKVYNKVLKSGRDAGRAAAAAGTKVHHVMGAAASRAGADYPFFRGSRLFIGEVKTHWVVEKVHPRILEWSREQALAYVLKAADEGKLIGRAAVHHIFINPQSGKAVQLFVEPFTAEELRLLQQLMR